MTRPRPPDSNVKPQTLFISDLHLAAERPQAVELFLQFASARARQADVLFILGDLFDAWIGDDDDGALAIRVRGALRDLTAAGVSVFFQGGNRDFLIGTRFAAETGVGLLPDYTVVDLYGTPTLLTHGDLLCTDDLDYQQARLMLRNPATAAAARRRRSRPRTSWT